MTERTRYLTEGQYLALQLLRRACDEDVAVHLGRATAWRAERPTVARATANRLVGNGLARFSRPSARFLLITPAGMGIPVLRGRVIA